MHAPARGSRKARLAHEPAEPLAFACSPLSFPQGLLGSERLASVPFLVLGNKIDVPSSAGDAELRAGIGLMETTGTDPEATKSTGVRPIELFLVSITKKTNIKPAFDWLSAYLK